MKAHNLHVAAFRFPAASHQGLCVLWFLLTAAALICRAENGIIMTAIKSSEGNATAGQVSIVFATDSNQPEPHYEGVPMSLWIQKNTVINPNHLSLSALMTMKQISPPDRMGVTKFALPINFVAFNTNWPDHAYVQIGMLSRSRDFIQCTFQGFERAGNGSLLIWGNMNYEPDKQDIRARLTYETNSDSIIVIGPPLPFDSHNACYFYEGDALYNANGATLHAKLREQNATYRLELTTPKGKHLKTITGSATNGVINSEWDLKDGRGKIYKGDSFEATFYIVYPGDTHTNAPVRNLFYRVPDRQP